MVDFDKKVLDKFLMWKSDQHYQTEEYDRRFVRTLLLIIVPEASLAASDVKKEVLDFILSKYFIKNINYNQPGK